MDARAAPTWLPIETAPKGWIWGVGAEGQYALRWLAAEWK